jgi:ribosomal protein S27E
MSAGLDDAVDGGLEWDVDARDYLDGNALAGPLAEFAAGDLTSAVGQCNSCGATSVLAGTRVYAHAPGLTARCTTCGSVLLRLSEAGGRTVLDLRGLRYLSIRRD